MPSLKEELQRKPLQEIEALIYDHRQKIEAEKNLINLGKLNSELAVMLELREEKLKASGRQIRTSNTSSSGKPALKSYDDYVKSKKK